MYKIFNIEVNNEEMSCRVVGCIFIIHRINSQLKKVLTLGDWENSESTNVYGAHCPRRIIGKNLHGQIGNFDM